MSFVVRCLLLLLLSLSAHAWEPPADPLLRMETGMHMAKIGRIGTDAQGRFALTVSHDKTARIWDTTSGRLLTIMRPPVDEGNEGKLYSGALSPDGSVVAVGGWSKENDIYLFDRSSGRWLRRVTGMVSTILSLAFSPDGRMLAVGQGSGGIRLLDAYSGRELGRDSAYTGASYSVAFSPDGSRLVATCEDGRLRLYGTASQRLEKQRDVRTTGGADPFMARFSPDGRRIAVGFSDTNKVDVVDGESLALDFQPNVTGVDNGNVSSVVWLTDGRLAAAGAWDRNSEFPVRLWSNGGRGAYSDVNVARGTVMDVTALPGGGLLFAASGPRWGRLSASGRIELAFDGTIADFPVGGSYLALSPDGHRLGFSFDRAGRQQAVFDLDRLELIPGAPNGLEGPRQTMPGLEVSNWRNTTDPKVNGAPVALSKFEKSHGVALAPDGQHFAVGADWNLRYFDHSGRELWRKEVPGVAWAVHHSRDGRWVVATYSDGSIRWHRASDGVEQLAFFAHADKKRWVVWSRSGYYAASPGAEDLFGWHLNHGKDAAADYFPASRFRSQFYRPDVVAKVLDTGDEAQALRLANQEAGRRPEVKPVAVQTVLPPVVSILSPNDGTTFSGRSVTIKYSVRAPADAPITGVRARVNGQAIALPEARNLKFNATAAAPASAQADVREITLPLATENSEIQLFAENKNGVSVPATVRLNWQGPAPNRDEFQIKPKLYVLAVGVSEYQNPDYRLKFAAKDAQDFAAAMAKQKGGLYREVEVKLLTDRAATRDEVVDGLDWLQKQVTAKDVGMVFLAGHGVNDPNGIYYFLPANADEEKLKRTGVAFSDIKNTLSSLAGKALFFVDSCHSGNVMGGRRGSNDITGVVNELASAENGVVVFAASTGKQYSLEDAAWGNGAFTKALVEGLSGRADLNKSGRITHKMLDFYIGERVKELTRGRQTPVNPSPQGVPDFPVAVVK